MDTQFIQAAQQHFARRSDPLLVPTRLARRRTWFDETETPPATVPYAEYTKLQGQYNGLKGHADSQKGLLDAATARLTELSQTHEGELSTLRSTLKTTETERELFRGQHETQKQRADRLDRENGLTKTILGKKEYAPLTDLLADGLLRTEGMTAEETTAYLDKMAAKFTGRVVDAAAERLQGSAPPAPEGSGGLNMTQEQMGDKLMTLPPGSKEYNDLLSAYSAGISKRNLVKTVVLVYKDKFTSIDGMTHLVDKDLSVSGDNAGVSFVPTENPVAIQIWANTGEIRLSRGCLLSALVHYHIES